MGLPLRPYVTTGLTTGVALAGATALAITPLALPPLQEDRAVKISAHQESGSVTRDVRLLSDTGLLDQFFNGGGLFNGNGAGLLPNIGDLLPDLSGLGGLGGALLDNVFVDLDTLDESLADAFAEANEVVAAEIAILPARFIHVATALGAGNPDAENHLLEGLILFVLDAVHPFVHAGIDHLNPAVGQAIHVAWDLADMVLRNFAGQWLHGVPGVYRPDPEEPAAEGAALAAGASALADDPADDSDGPGEQTILQRVVSAGAGLGRFGKEVVEDVTEELSGNGGTEGAGSEETDPVSDDSEDVDADEGSGVDDATPEADSGGEDSEDGQESDLDAQGSDSEDSDSDGSDGSDSESDQDDSDGTTPRLAKSFLDTTKGGKFTPRAIGNDAGPRGKKVFAAVTGGLSDAVKGFGERVKKFTGGGSGGDDSGADASGGDSGSDSSGSSD